MQKDGSKELQHDAGSPQLLNRGFSTVHHLINGFPFLHDMHTLAPMHILLQNPQLILTTILQKAQAYAI